MQVAGFFVQTIPDWIGWLKYLSFIYYGYNVLLKVSQLLLCRAVPCCAVLCCAVLCCAVL